MTTDQAFIIGIVGPCGAGKSTLAQGLKALGFNARPIAQEHSFVPDMWKRITNPHILIFLQASHNVGAYRREMSWTESEWQEQQRRLSNARENANLYLDTDLLDINGVLRAILSSLLP